MEEGLRDFYNKLHQRIEVLEKEMGKYEIGTPEREEVKIRLDELYYNSIVLINLIVVREG